MRRPWQTVALVLALMPWPPALQAAEPRRLHAIAMHGEPRYPAGFTHFDYVNPAAPKGGVVRMASSGTFDSLNSFILEGVPAAGLAQLYDTLLVRSADEPLTAYGLVAESIELAEDRSWIAFNLRDGARFHDGSPLTAEDVAWTFETLRTRGHPLYKVLYADVPSVEVLGPHKVRFALGDRHNRELPVIVGQLPVLSKAHAELVPFEKSGEVAPMGSGPYRIGVVEPGRSVTYVRDPDYWARDLAVSHGRFNFGQLRYDYYRDEAAEIQGLKAHAYDLRIEISAKTWATAYNIPAVSAGALIKDEIQNELPKGMQGFGYNLRRPIFQDRRVRAALAHAFDFEWSNRTLFHGLYARSNSYFADSSMAAEGLPSPEELALLEPLRDRLPPEVFTDIYRAPDSQDPRKLRENLLQAMALLKQAGWTVQGGKLRNAAGERFRFEILIDGPSFERLALPFARNLERLGIEVGLRTVDVSQYQYRLNAFDLDMIVVTFPITATPGTEVRTFWGSAAADEPGSKNALGIRDPAIDRLIEHVVSAGDRQRLETATRALDRALLWGHYMIPHYYTDTFRMVYWDMFGRPEVTPKYDLLLDTWWVADPTAPVGTIRQSGMRGARRRG